MGQRAAQRGPFGFNQPCKGGLQVQDHYTAVLKKKGDWWIGWIEEIPGVNCQEKAKEHVIATLRITLREALEFNRQEALDAAGRDTRSKKSPYEAPRVASASPSPWMSAVVRGNSALVVA
jgi:hypothetical protein